MRTCCISILVILSVLTGTSNNVEIEWPNMPVLYITTVDGITPTCTIVNAPVGCIGTSITDNSYIPGRMVMVLNGDTLYDSKEYVDNVSGMKIKIRGNSTGAMLAQHPYKLKLTKKYDLLRRGDNDFKHKKWLLLSMYTWNKTFSNEESNVLNIAGMLVSKILKKEWTPEYEFVNMVLNGEYQGMYYLMESVDKGPKRIDISDDGFLIEHDTFWWNEDIYFKTNHQSYETGYTYKYPDSDDINDSIQNMVQSYMNNVEECLYSQGNIADYIDLESFAKWILIHDIIGTDDSAGCNRFLCRHDMNPDTKLQMGPVWDYDSMFRSNELSALHYSQQWFYYPLLFERDDFKQVYLNLWEQVKPTLISEFQEGISKANNLYSESFDKSMKIHQTKYPNEGHQSFASQMDEIMEKMEKRVEIVDSIITKTIILSSINKISEKASLTGITDYKGNSFNISNSKQLPQGVYLFKYSDGHIRKVVINSVNNY